MRTVGKRTASGLGAGVLLAIALAACGEPTGSGVSEHPQVQADGGSPDGGDARTDDTNAPFVLETILETADYRLFAADAQGTIYATRHTHGSSRLFASTDRGSTFVERARLAAGTSFRQMSVLSDGVLLALVRDDTGKDAIWRSADRGATWAPVLPLGDMTILTPHSIGELAGEVFLGEYQAWTGDSVPLNLWVSADRGLSWQVRTVFQGRRHVHGLRTDPDRGRIYVFFGDNEQRTGILRSDDGGHTFVEALMGHDGSAVDAVITPDGLLFGQDVVTGPWPPMISLYTHRNEAYTLQQLPGPSYSVHAVPGGGYVMGITREPQGDWYPPDFDGAQLWGSRDGTTWGPLERFARTDTTKYARADVYYTLPGGELLVQLHNVEPMGAGWGFRVVRARPR